MDVEKTLATELLHEVKMSAKRWFIIAIAELVVIAILIVMLFTVPIEESTVTVDNADGNANYVGGDVNGGLYNGENNENVPQTENDR